MSSLTRKNPTVSEECPRGDCPLGSQSCAGRCSVENILYKAVCNRCRDEQVNQGVNPDQVTDSMYIGESARTMRVRAGQHFSDYIRCAKVNKDPDSEDMKSFMWDHHCQVHGGGQDVTKEHYSFQVVKQFRDSMTRQQEEAIRIQIAIQSDRDITNNGNTVPIKLLNRKSEYFAPRKRNLFNQQT